MIDIDIMPTEATLYTHPLLQQCQLACCSLVQDDAASESSPCPTISNHQKKQHHYQCHFRPSSHKMVIRTLASAATIGLILSQPTLCLQAGLAKCTWQGTMCIQLTSIEAARYQFQGSEKPLLCSWILLVSVGQHTQLVTCQWI